MPYYWAGSKAYDVVAGGSGLRGSYFVSPRSALQAYPLLNPKGLVGSMIYYDGTLFSECENNFFLTLNPNSKNPQPFFCLITFVKRMCRPDE